MQKDYYSLTTKEADDLSNKVRMWEEYKLDKNFVEADLIRDELIAAGVDFVTMKWRPVLEHPSHREKRLNSRYGDSSDCSIGSGRETDPTYIYSE